MEIKELKWKRNTYLLFGVVVLYSKALSEKKKKNSSVKRMSTSEDVTCKEVAPFFKLAKSSVVVIDTRDGLYDRSIVSKFSGKIQRLLF